MFAKGEEMEVPFPRQAHTINDRDGFPGAINSEEFNIAAMRRGEGGSMAQRGINKVILVGRLGQDPESKYMPSGDCVVNASLATSETWKDKNTSENVEKTEWHRIVMFGRRAEVFAEYTRKGSQVYVEGKLQTRKWQDRDGNDRYTTEVKVEDFQFLDSKGSNAGMGAPQAAPQAAVAGGAPSMPVDGPDDDIPF